MKLRNRKTKLLNLSESLAQSNWAAELHKSPVVRRAPTGAPTGAPDPSAEIDASFTDANFVPKPPARAAMDGNSTAQARNAKPSSFDPATIPVAKFTPQQAISARSADADHRPRKSGRDSDRDRATSTPDRSKIHDELGSARYAYLAAGLAGVVWAGGFIAFVMGYQRNVRPLTYPPFQAVVLAMLIILPITFMLLAAFAIRQGARLGWETRKARKLAQDMVQPAALAAGQTCDIAELVRQEVQRAADASAAASNQLAGLREGLSRETERLTEASVEAQRMAQAVVETLSLEREGVAALSASLHNGAIEIGEAVKQQTRLVADASDLARSQLHEAEATLVARAADLAQTAAVAESAAREATEHLARQTERLDLTAAALVERLRHLDARLAEQRNGLTELLESCNFDQEDIAARLETRRAQLIEVIAQSRLEATGLGQASSEGAGALRALMGVASEQLRDLVLTAETEHANLTQRAAEMRAEVEADLHRSVAAFDAAAKAAYGELGAQANQSREAAATYVEAAKAEVEQLGELAFEAGQRAGKAFDARVGEARKLIEDSVVIIEAAGSKSTDRIQSGLVAIRSALGDLADALADVDAKTAKLPDDVRARVEALRLVVDKGVDDLTVSAHRVADETQFIDAAFQARVKRNYETLHDATRLMGQAPIGDEAHARAPAMGRTAKSPASDFAAEFGSLERGSASVLASRSNGLTNGSGAGAYVNAAPTPVGVSSLSDEDDRAAASIRPFAQPVEAESLRPRLRLTPTESDTALKTVFDPLQVRAREPETTRTQGEGATERSASRPADAEMDEWSWTDLLSSLEDKPIGDDALSEQMIGEIAALGVDAGALLPHVRVEEIAAALQAGDASSARDSVRRVAPAAIRRLSRRVLTDTALREQADRYVRRYQLLLRGSSDRGEGATSTLLSSDSGRAYLLLDAAVGDLQ